MGRKGVSKRKPSQTKSKPLPGKNDGGNEPSIVQTAEGKPVKSYEIGKAVSSIKGGEKSSSDWKKNSKKG